MEKIAPEGTRIIVAELDLSHVTRGSIHSILVPESEQSAPIMAARRIAFEQLQAAK